MYFLMIPHLNRLFDQAKQTLITEFLIYVLLMSVLQNFQAWIAGTGHKMKVWFWLRELGYWNRGGRAWLNSGSLENACGLCLSYSVVYSLCSIGYSIASRARDSHLMSLRGDSGKRENTQVIYKETEMWGKVIIDLWQKEKLWKTDGDEGDDGMGREKEREWEWKKEIDTERTAIGQSYIAIVITSKINAH